MLRLNRTLALSLLARLLLAPAIGAALCLAGAQARADNAADAEFKGKLSDMLSRTEKSIKVLREQLTESSHAPFLADLYVQLGDLLAQKATTLYYIQMEKMGKSDVQLKADQDSPVVVATKEAIAVYQQILREFPAYTKRGMVQYRVALALNSIGAIPQFIQICSQLMKEAPHSEEGVRAALLMGQHFFDGQDWHEAMGFYERVASSSMVYERNLAKYRIGLIDINLDRNKEALQEFEEVVKDPDLKEQDNPYDVALKTKAVKSDLKREALIDSIRAFTKVHDKGDIDPVAYYSRIAPTEIHFQEVMEKLALRYVFLKKFESAVKLLRTVGERTVDPQKIVNIYQQVLLLIPVRDRITIPVDEMAYVLQKYNLWVSFYDLPQKLLRDSYIFFEKQVRELATFSHQTAKSDTEPTRKAAYLHRARDYYLLYIANFNNSPEKVKMSTNLADVYFLLKDNLNAGDYYLRTFQGEFGTPVEKRLLIENAILCLQKDADGLSFYERLRMKGLLIKALSTFIAFDPKQKTDPKTNFSLAKAQYDQAFFPQALENLYSFMKRFRGTHQSIDAGELIMDYFNTRNDFSGLELWVDRMLSLKLPDQAFNTKLRTVKTQAKTKVIQEKVKSVAGYDEFAQGKSYLAAALSSDDPALANAVLQEALARSKRERDINTFLEAASIMADKESNPQKRAAILSSIARENFKISRYYTGLKTLRRLAGSAEAGQKLRIEALEEATNVALMLRDWKVMQEFTSQPLFASASNALKSRVRDQIADIYESPAAAPSDLGRVLLSVGISDDALLALYKSESRIDSATRNRVLTETHTRCGASSRQAVCLWIALERTDFKKERVVAALAHGPFDVKSIEGYAPMFMGVAADYQQLEQSGDAQLEMLVSLRNAEIYRAFSGFLTRAAQTNPDLRADLVAKARESQGTAATYLKRCQAITQRFFIPGSIAHYCATGESPAARDFLDARTARVSDPSRSDLTGEEISGAQKDVFVKADDADLWLKLANEYYKAEAYRLSAAVSTYAATQFKNREGDFNAILGCSVAYLGLFNEAEFHLKAASDYGALKPACMKMLADFRSRL